jgi:hypothetical protein
MFLIFLALATGMHRVRSSICAGLMLIWPVARPDRGAIVGIEGWKDQT